MPERAEGGKGAPERTPPVSQRNSVTDRFRCRPASFDHAVYFVSANENPFSP
ncbi:hypothetical protein Bra5_CH03717 [Rhizobium phaseoli Brasil 5]|nr:hypothetical protein Bra5_CH03717 [Rhizobium phaseoli Brasil 5]